MIRRMFPLSLQVPPTTVEPAGQVGPSREIPSRAQPHSRPTRRLPVEPALRSACDGSSQNMNAEDKRDDGSPPERPKYINAVRRDRRARLTPGAPAIAQGSRGPQ